MENIFLQITIILGITVSIACFVRLLKQPLIVAYILAGLVAGPLFLNVINGDEQLFQTFANFGIILLLFIVGLSLNFDYIKKVGKTVFLGGLFQFFFTAFIGFFVMSFLNFSFISSLFVAVAITFSSTIIVVKLLADKKDLETVYGRYTIGVLLVQDIIAVILMIFLNTSNINQDVSWYNTALITLGKGMLLAGLVFLMAKYLLPIFMDKIATSSELLFIFTIAWCFGIASIVYSAGFSVEIGAIVAGISLGASIYQPEISSRLRPLRDFFIVLFFVVLGSELQLGDVKASLLPAIILSLVVLIVDPLILYIVMRKIGHTRRSSFLAGITAAQVSEFGFILIFKGEDMNYLHGSELAILTIVALTTIIISSYLITYNEQIYQKIMPILKRFGKDDHNKDEKEKIPYKIWLLGYDRIGWKVCEALLDKKANFAVIDFNPEAIKKLKRKGVPCFFGDCADVEFLESLPLEKAEMIISTIPEYDDQRTLIGHIRKYNKKTKIVANLYYKTHLQDLYDIGADYVMLAHLLVGEWLADFLKKDTINVKKFKYLRDRQKSELKMRYPNQ
ncbi:MAG: cation:proton antiporter [Patescibacteria group bacterium]